jgi:hypothetical protein
MVHCVFINYVVLFTRTTIYILFIGTAHALLLKVIRASLAELCSQLLRSIFYFTKHLKCSSGAELMKITSPFTL